jgi:hypothetical protein
MDDKDNRPKPRQQEAAQESEDGADWADKTRMNQIVQERLEEYIETEGPSPSGDVAGPHAKFDVPVSETKEDIALVRSFVKLPKGGEGMCSFRAPIPNPHNRLQAVYDYYGFDDDDEKERPYYEDLFDRDIPVRELHIPGDTPTHWVLDLPGRSKTIFRMRRWAQEKGLVTWKRTHKFGRRWMPNIRWKFADYSEPIESKDQGAAVYGQNGNTVVENKEIDEKPVNYEIQRYRYEMKEMIDDYDRRPEIGEVFGLLPRFTIWGKLMLYSIPAVIAGAAFALSSSILVQGAALFSFLFMWILMTAFTTLSATSEQWLTITDIYSS